MYRLWRPFSSFVCVAQQMGPRDLNDQCRHACAKGSLRWASWDACCNMLHSLPTL